VNKSDPRFFIGEVCRFAGLIFREVRVTWADGDTIDLQIDKSWFEIRGLNVKVVWDESLTELRSGLQELRGLLDVSESKEATKLLYAYPEDNIITFFGSRPNADDLARYADPSKRVLLAIEKMKIGFPDGWPAEPSSGPSENIAPM
jgi:hypothetical protein